MTNSLIPQLTRTRREVLFNEAETDFLNRIEARQAAARGNADSPTIPTVLSFSASEVDEWAGRTRDYPTIKILGC